MALLRSASMNFTCKFVCGAARLGHGDVWIFSWTGQGQSMVGRCRHSHPGFGSRSGRQKGFNQPCQLGRLVVVQHVTGVLHLGHARLRHQLEPLVVIGQGVAAFPPL